MNTQEEEPPSVVVYDLSTSHKSPATVSMYALKPGGPRYFHDHRKMQTKFSVWIATRRRRMGRQFKWEAAGEPGFYNVWVD